MGQLTRQQVYTLVDGERDYQDAFNQHNLPIEGELLLLEEYCTRARKTYTNTFNDPEEIPTLDAIRKIAGLAVRCIEHHGAPPRQIPGPS